MSVDIEHKDFHLPLSFSHESFHDMESWVPSQHDVNPRPSQVSDTSNPNVKKKTKALMQKEETSPKTKIENTQAPMQINSSQVSSQFVAS